MCRAPASPEGTSRCPSPDSRERRCPVALVIPDVLLEDCATREALELLAAKWRVLLIYALRAGPQRHAELRRRLPGITQKVLTETLRSMQADGLVERRVLKDTAPQHVEYSLTALGTTL